MIKSSYHLALVVDEDEKLVSLLASLLKVADIDSLTASCIDEATKIINSSKALDLLVVDYNLPNGDASTIIEYAKSKMPNVPVIVLSENIEAVNFTLLVAGANLVMPRPIKEGEFIATSKNLINLSNASENLENAENVISAFSTAIEARDIYTQGHSIRVAKLAVQLYDVLDFKNKFERSALYVGCVLHDIGKIGVPDHILKSENKLTDSDLSLIKTHPEIGYNICKKIQGLAPALDVILYHHERLDGSGYPERLDGENIPKLAQIAAIPDVYDALTTARSYRVASSSKKAIEILTKEADEGKINKDVFFTFCKHIIERN